MLSRPTPLALATYALLLCAMPLAAQDDCLGILKVVHEAFSKQVKTPTHVYNTQTINGKSTPSEAIYANDTVYMKMDDKWVAVGSTKDIAPPNKTRQPGPNDSCHYVKDESLSGEPTALYSTHSLPPSGKVVEMQIWISKSSGLPLRTDIKSNDGQTLLSTKFAYTNVKPPL